MTFSLVVFCEFARLEMLKQCESLGIRVDQATAPISFAKSDAEKHIVATNAKLFFDPATSAEEVEAILQKLQGIGFAVAVRNPITSAGCPMKDRVILSLRE